MHGSLRVNAFKESLQSKTNFVLLYLNHDINYYHKNFQESKMQFFGICFKVTNAKTSHSKIRTLQVSTMQKKPTKNKSTQDKLPSNCHFVLCSKKIIQFHKCLHNFNK